MALTNITTDLSIGRLGLPGGFCPLDGTGQVPGIHIPGGVGAALTYVGGYDASTNTPDLTNVAQQVNGHLYIVTVAGTQDIGNGPETFTVGDSVHWSDTDSRWYCLQSSVTGIEVIYDNSGTAIVGINVQDAITELDNRVQPLEIEVDTVDPTSTDVRVASKIWYNSETGNHFISYKSEEFVTDTVNNDGLTHDDPQYLADDSLTDILILSGDIEPGVPIERAGDRIRKITFKGFDASIYGGGSNFITLYVVPDTNPPGDPTGAVDGFFDIFSNSSPFDIVYTPNIDLIGVGTGYKIVLDLDDEGDLQGADESGTFYPNIEIEYISTVTTQENQRWSRLDGRDTVTTGYLYIDPVNGDDAFDGLTDSTPVLTTARAQELLDSYIWKSKDLTIEFLSASPTGNYRLQGDNITFLTTEPVDDFSYPNSSMYIIIPTTLGTDTRFEFTDFRTRVFVRGTSDGQITFSDNAQLRFIRCGYVKVTSDVKFDAITDNDTITFYDCDHGRLDRLRLANLTFPFSLGSAVQWSNCNYAGIDNGIFQDDLLIELGVNSYLLEFDNVDDVLLNLSGPDLKFLSGRFFNLSSRNLPYITFTRDDFDDVTSETKVNNTLVGLPSLYRSSFGLVKNGVVQDDETVTLTNFYAPRLQPFKYTRTIAQTPGENRVYLPSQSWVGIYDGAEITILNDSSSTESVEVYGDTFVGYHFDRGLVDEYDANDGIRYFPYEDFAGTITDISTTNAITGANGDDVLYQSGISATGTWSDFFSDTDNGRRYKLVFRWAEIDPAITGAGQRVFNVEIDNVVVASNVDIYAAAGGNDIAYDLEIEFVADGQSIIEVVPVTGEILVQSFYIEPLDPVAIVPPGDTATFGLIDQDVWELMVAPASPKLSTNPPSTTILIDATGGDDTNDGFSGAIQTTSRLQEVLTSYHWKGATVTVDFSNFTSGVILTFDGVLGAGDILLDFAGNTITSGIIILVEGHNITGALRVQDLTTSVDVLCANHNTVVFQGTTTLTGVASGENIAFDTCTAAVVSNLVVNNVTGLSAVKVVGGSVVDRLRVNVDSYTGTNSFSEGFIQLEGNVRILELDSNAVIAVDGKLVNSSLVHTAYLNVQDDSAGNLTGTVASTYPTATSIEGSDYDNTISGLTATTQKGAIDELATTQYGRTKLTTDTTFFLDATLGNDANDGLAAGAGNAWQNLDVAYNRIRDEYDLNGYYVTFQLADGVYSPSLATTYSFEGLTGAQYRWVNQYPITIQGNSGDSTAVKLDANCIRVYDEIRFFNLTATRSVGVGACVFECHNVRNVLFLQNVNFEYPNLGSSTTAIFANDNCFVRIIGTYSIEGDIDQFISAEGNAQVIAGGTLTLVDSTVKANFIKATGGAYVFWGGTVVNPANWNGTQYDIRSGSTIIHTNPLPGTGFSTKEPGTRINNEFVDAFYDNTTSGLTAVTQQAAIDELASTQGVKPASPGAGIYIHFGTGDDNNDGFSSGQAVQTIGKVQDILESYNWDNQSAVSIYVETSGTLGTLNLQSVEGAPKIIIRTNTSANLTGSSTVEDYPYDLQFLGLGIQSTLTCRRVHSIEVQNCDVSGAGRFTMVGVSYLFEENCDYTNPTATTMWFLDNVGSVVSQPGTITGGNFTTAFYRVYTGGVRHLMIRGNQSITGRLIQVVNLSVDRKAMLGAISNVSGMSGSLADEIDISVPINGLRPYDNATSGLTATDIDAAIDELDGRLDTVEGNLGAQPLTVNRVILSGSPTLTVTDDVYQHIVDMTTAGQTINLPASPVDGTRFVFKMKSTSANSVTINSTTLNPGEVYEVVYDGVEWVVI